MPFNLDCVCCISTMCMLLPQYVGGHLRVPTQGASTIIIVKLFCFVFIK